jgi:hypothetical protein
MSTAELNKTKLDLITWINRIPATWGPLIIWYAPNLTIN